MEKHGGDQLPGIMLSRDEAKILRDPEIRFVIIILKENKDRPIGEKETESGQRNFLQLQVGSDRKHCSNALRIRVFFENLYAFEVPNTNYS